MITMQNLEAITTGITVGGFTGNLIGFVTAPVARKVYNVWTFDPDFRRHVCIGLTGLVGLAVGMAICLASGEMTIAP